jgi:hypothetical protein
MNKTLTYSGFAISSILLILAFVTARTYSQLAIAIIVYPLLAYFALRMLPRRPNHAPAITIEIPKRTTPKIDEDRAQRVVADIDKRTFIKLIGTAGLSFFFFSLLGRRVESLFFGNTFQATNTSGTLPSSQTPQSTQPFEGYKISEIDDGVVSYYGFINREGAWLIMQEDTRTSSFRYAKGNLNFSSNWSAREGLKYDYYFNLF